MAFVVLMTIVRLLMIVCNSKRCTYHVLRGSVNTLVNSSWICQWYLVIFDRCIIDIL